MKDKLQSLLEQLTPAERNGAVLSVCAPIPHTTCSPRAMRAEMESAIMNVSGNSDCTDAQTSSIEK